MGVGGGVGVSVKVAVGCSVSPGFVGTGVDVGGGVGVGVDVGVDVGVCVAVEVGLGVGVGGGGTGVFVETSSMGKVSVGVPLTSRVKVAAEVPSACATKVDVGVFLGAEVMAAEVHATNKSSSATNWTHSSFFILSSSSKLRHQHYSLKWHIAQARLLPVARLQESCPQHYLIYMILVINIDKINNLWYNSFS